MIDIIILHIVIDYGVRWCEYTVGDAMGILTSKPFSPNLRSFRRGFPGCALAQASVDDASRLQFPSC